MYEDAVVQSASLEGQNTLHCTPTKMMVECMHVSEVATQYEL